MSFSTGAHNLSPRGLDVTPLLIQVTVVYAVLSPLRSRTDDASLIQEAIIYALRAALWATSQ